MCVWDLFKINLGHQHFPWNFSAGIYTLKISVSWKFLSPGNSKEKVKRERKKKGWIWKKRKTKIFHKNEEPEGIFDTSSFSFAKYFQLTHPGLYLFFSFLPTYFFNILTAFPLIYCFCLSYTAFSVLHIQIFFSHILLLSLIFDCSLFSFILSFILFLSPNLLSFFFQSFIQSYFIFHLLFPLNYLLFDFFLLSTFLPFFLWHMKMKKIWNKINERSKYYICSFYLFHFIFFSFSFTFSFSLLFLFFHSIFNFVFICFFHIFLHLSLNTFSFSIHSFSSFRYFFIFFYLHHSL